MTTLFAEVAWSCSSQRYLHLVQDLLWRYRQEADAIALELAEAYRELEVVEDQLRRPELPRTRELLDEHECVSQRVEGLERDLADAREAARGAQEELAGIEAALAG